MCGAYGKDYSGSFVIYHKCLIGIFSHLILQTTNPTERRLLPTTHRVRGEHFRNAVRAICVCRIAEPGDSRCVRTRVSGHGVVLPEASQRQTTIGAQDHHWNRAVIRFKKSQ